MTGYVMAYGPCIGCRKLFGFNPHKVPSLPVNGVRQPVCRDCVERANPRRIKNGLPPIVPAADAYEAIEEGEL